MPTAMAQHGPRAVVSYLLLQIHFTVALFLLHPSSAGALTGNNTASMAVPCLPDQASALLRLKRSFTTTNYSAITFRSWRAGTDCCLWMGIQCGDSDGRVTSLHLGDHGLETGGLEPALFDLTDLKYVNLAYNDFNGSRLPSSGFERLVKLTHLNLSSSNFSGQVPAGINKLVNLVSLDLSTGFETFDLLDEGWYLVVPRENSLTEQNFETLVRNLSNLRELHLGFVDLSSSRTQWCNIMAKSCPRLQVLSLPFCYLSGPICSALSSLHSLAVVDLQHNQLSGPIPYFLTNFSNLIVLQLRFNKLHGWISPAIFQHKKLVTIDLFNNPEISGHLPNFSVGSKLENINVGYTNFSGMVPASLNNLASLKTLDLGTDRFFGELPSSIGNLKSLSELRVSGMGIEGSIPSWFANLTSLKTLKLYHCGLSGWIPSFIGHLKNLQQLFLCKCGFSGEIPPHILNLTQLQDLYLYSNNFVGTVELTFFSKLVNLRFLDISDNNLVVEDGEYNSSLKSFPKLLALYLAGCNMSTFPDFLRHQDEIKILDLSFNHIHGPIPRWAWEVWNNIIWLNLANNGFTSVNYGPILPMHDAFILDFSNNLFEGTIPIPQGSAQLQMLSYSNNMFSSIPSNLSYHLSSVPYFQASGNHLSGNLSASFCGGMNITFLDLSYNNFSGSIPSCLMENVNGMQSLMLRSNQLHGEIPDSNKEGCSFEALDFSSNQIKGELPRSLIACKNLRVLDVANNQISDSFPCWMSGLPRLQVLVLKSNKFFGQIEGYSCEFSRLRVLDVASNNFSGTLTNSGLIKLTSMIVKTTGRTPVIEYKDELLNNQKYQFTIVITYKGLDLSIANILATIVFIDISNNAFHGIIPQAIGNLVCLNGLNMSHNSFTGPIPPHVGRLNQLEALDLSFNELSGKIPRELAGLDFLAVLNLSYNKLEGEIPELPHFLTFSNSSFWGNDGLCGSALSKECSDTTKLEELPHPSQKKCADIMLFLFTGLGFGVGFAVAIVATSDMRIRIGNLRMG